MELQKRHPVSSTDEHSLHNQRFKLIFNSKFDIFEKLSGWSDGRVPHSPKTQTLGGSEAQNSL